MISLIPKRLRLEAGIYCLLSCLGAAAGGYLISAEMGASCGWTWGILTSLVLGYQFTSLWLHLPDNHKTGQVQPLPYLGAANWITLLRGGLLAGLAGFLLMPKPIGWLAWAPGSLYLVASLLDYLDGAVARLRGESTALGEWLDMAWDGFGAAIACTLTVIYGQAPFWYLLVGAARYLYLLGLWWYQKRGRPLDPLAPDRVRRAMAGLQIGFIAAILLPVFPPLATSVAATLFMVPFLAGFYRDWRQVTRQKTLYSLRVPPVLSWFIRAVSVTISIISLVIQYRNLSSPSLFIMSIGTILIAMGVIPRIAALMLLLHAGFILQADISNPYAWAQAASMILLLYTGTGKYSLWTPENWILENRIGD
ncbi:MAG TPA: CDP-alcohol phosphatidyltransferase family protein [Anaerolineaceae bacterium]